jgi:phage-related baseplate assembly protein
MIGDTISIKDAFVINFSINFEIITYPNFNSNEVIEKCITSLKNYFNIDKWQLNQPIIIQTLQVLLDRIDGVQTVKNIFIKNKTGT